jgi:hypothetical protein
VTYHVIGYRQVLFDLTDLMVNKYHRVELDDIERTIKDAVPGVMAVSVQPDRSGTTLCAFVAPSAIRPEVVQSAVKVRLPAYMVPSSIYPLDTLPLNSSDKVDHKKIRISIDEFISRSRAAGRTRGQKLHTLITPPDTWASGTPISKASSAIESPKSTAKILKEIWKKVLDFDRELSLDDNFFDLGGNRYDPSHILHDFNFC